MKPTNMCMVVRKFAKALDVNLITDHNGIGSIDWKTSHSIEETRRLYLFHNLTRKIEMPGDADTLKGAALRSFLSTEDKNLERNADILSGRYLKGNNALIMRLIRARGVIAQILGNSPDTSVLTHCHFTGGASTSRTRGESFVPLKYVPTWDTLTCTSEAKPWFELFVTHHWLAYSAAVETSIIRDVTIREHARWSSVPKDSSTDRSIVVGNDCNVLLQRGAGIAIKERLLHYGIDLTDQSRNRALARKASITDKLVTHDAVDSSNRILDECVRLLLPGRWYNYLNALREKTCILPDGTIHRLEMFSSMGNGFTFELQSLIYFALCIAASGCSAKGAVDTGIGVFGDDVVIPTVHYDKFLELITSLGMEANMVKTASAGLFRESCGGHYMFGTDISPFFIREPFSQGPHVVFKFVNELRDWYYGNYHDNYDPKIEDVIRQALTEVKERNQVPLEYSPDSGLYSALDCNIPVLWYKHRRTQQERLKFVCYTETIEKVVINSSCDLPWYLYVLWSGHRLDGRRYLTETGARKRTTITVAPVVKGRHPGWVLRDPYFGVEG